MMAVKSQFFNFTMSRPRTEISRPFVSGKSARFFVGSTRINGGVFVKKFFADLMSPRIMRLVVPLRNYQTRLDSV